MTIILISVLILLAILLLAGPRIRIDTFLKPVSLPEIHQLDDYLSAIEANIPDLIENTEKIIRWYGKKGEKTKYSIIYIHGFTATRQETAPVTDFVAQKLHANVFYCRLKGHGRDAEAMKNPTVNDWINDVYEAYEIGIKIGDRVIIIATSTGVPLGLWLCLYFEMLAAAVLLSPNFGPADRMSNLILLPWGNVLIKLFAGNYMQWDYINELQTKYWTTRYRSEALLPMMGICELGKKLDLQNIQLPVLCLYTENDKVVSIPALKKAFQQIGSKKKKIINTRAGDHVLAGDILSPAKNESTVNEIVEFLNEML